MHDLSTMIEAIVQQRPGLAPDWLEDHGATGWRDARTGERFCTDAVILIIEAALWRALRRKQSTQSTSRRRGHESCGVWIGPTNGHWYAKTGRIHAKAVDFGDGDRALVRALCHAIGIEVAHA